MARKAVSMNKTRDILRLRHQSCLGIREIARGLGVSHATVVNYLQRAEAAGLCWPLPDGMDDAALGERLLGVRTDPSPARRVLPDMAQVHNELKSRRKGMTLRLLWEEYRAEHPEGYGYTQFCAYYKRFVGGLDPVLRQTYQAGEKLFVDWAGDTCPVVDPAGGATRTGYLFVATLGASNYTYVEAFEHMRLDAWIEAHIHAWEFFGGVTAVTVPDNPKTGVTHACRYDPVLNRTYRELADHYGTVIIPARPGKGPDKAKVEKAVLDVERRILAVLRHERFFSIGELNAALRKPLHALNHRPFQKMPGSRAQWFKEIDQPALRPLPGQRYEMAQWRVAKVNIDYHVQVDWHCYSVPSHLLNQKVEVRLCRRTVEIFHQGRRVALHARDNRRGGMSTDPSHRPKAHQKHLEWTPSRLIRWAANEVGTYCAKAIEQLITGKPHPEQGYRASLGIMRLGRRYGPKRLEAACLRAVKLDACNYRSISSILDTGLDQQPLPGPEPAPDNRRIVHANLRGGDYYRTAESIREHSQN